jgi:cephalosporin hydroxylase
LEFVTKDLNKGCDHLFVYKGIRCSQSPNVLTSLDKLTDSIKDNLVKHIIEIGTFNGGFTNILHDHDISSEAEVHTFDINHVSVKLENVVYHVGDCLTQNKQKIIDLVQQDGRTLLFCDGGNKITEVNTFCSHLKTGDIILCHDYLKTFSLLNTKESGF